MAVYFHRFAAAAVTCIVAVVEVVGDALLVLDVVGCQLLVVGPRCLGW